jgi:hypothetical protein
VHEFRGKPRRRPEFCALDHLARAKPRLFFQFADGAFSGVSASFKPPAGFPKECFSSRDGTGG